MFTQILSAIDAAGRPDPDAIKEAAILIKYGDVVAFPTETVYGLGATAYDSRAVKKIFAAKGRPPTNPLIVHVENIEQARQLVTEWPASADILARAYWPGPLTLILKKRDTVPGVVTAGGDTVAIRCPDHPVALALLKACGKPLAAPSANRSNYISPTSAKHVYANLQGRIPLILDGGPCRSGIESTVLNLQKNPAVILRPGPITAEMIESKLGRSSISTDASVAVSGIAQSPGQMPVHYSPNTPLILAPKSQATQLTDRLEAEGKKAVLMQMVRTSKSLSGREAMLPGTPLRVMGLTVAPMPNKPAVYARLLYATLHLLDAMELDVIVCELPPDGPQWSGIHDRLSRAAHDRRRNNLRIAR